jgi:type II protein arginine methyltransferase
VVGAGIAERAQVLVTEIFSGELISEGVLATIEHAHQQLLTGDAVVIPAAASAMGYLVGGPVIEKMLFSGVSNGFDLSRFNDFAPPVLPITLEAFPHEILSADTELLRFDLTSKLFPMGNRPINIMATQHGVCAGIAQWIRLDLDASTRYENRPALGGDGSGHWPQMLYRFPRLVRVKPGDVLKVNIRHDRKQIAVDLVE